MLVLLSFLSTAVFPAQPEYCLIIFLQVMLQGSLASWLKLTSDLFDTLGLCYRIVAFLHWRNHCAASRENRDSNGLFPSRNSAQQHKNMDKWDCDFLQIDHMQDQWIGHIVVLPVLFTRIPSTQHIFDNVVSVQ